MAFLAGIPALFGAMGAGGAGALGAGSALAGAAPAAGAATGIGSALGAGANAAPALGGLMSVAPEAATALGGEGGGALSSLMNMAGGTPGGGGGGADIMQSAPMQSLFGSPAFGSTGKDGAQYGVESGMGAQLLPDMNDPKELIGGDLTQIIDPYDAVGDFGKWDNQQLAMMDPEGYAKRSNEFADRGLEQNKIPELGGMSLAELMKLMQGQVQPQASPMQSSGYANKYIQGLMGGM